MVFVHWFPPGLHFLACDRDPFFPSWSQPRKLSGDFCKLHSMPSLAVVNRHADLCHWLYLQPSPHLSLSLWPRAGDLSLMECIPALPWGGSALPFLHTLHPIEGAATRRRQTRAFWTVQTQTIERCSTNKIINKIHVVCCCWTNYFLRKAQKAVWEPDVGIWNHTILLFL